MRCCIRLATGGTISISALFMAGVPGLLLGFSLIILCLADRLTRQASMARPWRKDALKITIDAAWGR